MRTIKRKSEKVSFQFFSLFFSLQENEKWNVVLQPLLLSYPKMSGLNESNNCSGVPLSLSVFVRRLKEKEEEEEEEEEERIPKDEK